MPLPKIQVSLKSGEEKLLLNDTKLPFALLDFWRWSASDILSNATRGRFAEFIVATATNVDIKEVRDEWGAFDLITPEGIKIEVKSAAYIQTWEQKQLSKIAFSTKLAKPWNMEADKRSDIAVRSADVYVFCLLHHDQKLTCDPLNLDHWEFYVLSTSDLNAYERSQQSISLKSLKNLTSAVTYESLNERITSKHRDSSSKPEI